MSSLSSQPVSVWLTSINADALELSVDSLILSAQEVLMLCSVLWVSIASTEVMKVRRLPVLSHLCCSARTRRCCRCCRAACCGRAAAGGCVLSRELDGGLLLVLLQTAGQVGSWQPMPCSPAVAALLVESSTLVLTVAIVRLTRGAVQSHATWAGGGPKAWACKRHISHFAGVDSGSCCGVESSSWSQPQASLLLVEHFTHGAFYMVAPAQCC